MFNETRLLDCVAYGSQFGQEFKTRIVTLRSGQERRNAQWTMPLGRYTVLYQALQPEDHTAVRAAHMASMGAAIPFRFKDWTDYQATNEVIGTATGDPQELQLTKAYTFGSLTLSRTINKPVADTVLLYADGVEIGVAVDEVTGIVSFIADLGAEITWTGEFDVPVRFDNDRLDMDPAAKSAGNFLLTGDVDLTEVRL
jgi:uncharacterized protein (TIGR02217 family)